ncbi:MAG: hypothetical protein ACK5LC_11855 [Coprobacillaceae bacterium]
MSKLKVTKVLKLLLITILTFTSLGIFELGISAGNEFDIHETVTYSDDERQASITLDTTSIGEGNVLEEVKDPEGNVMNITNPTYIVTENKTYEFYISYFDKENEKRNYTKKVEVNEIKAVDRSGLTRTTDYTSQVEILDFDILDGSGVSLSEINQPLNGRNYQLLVDWELSPENGATLQENDTFSIPLPTNEIRGNWSAMSSEYTNLTDTTGTITLGQWKIENNKIVVVLGANVNGSYTINGTMTTGKETLKNNNTVTITQKVTMGAISKSITFKGSTLGTMTKEDIKSSGTASNSLIHWGIGVNMDGPHELAELPWGTNFALEDTYVEDTLNGELVSLEITGVIRFPVDLIDGKPSGSSRTYSLISKFTRIYQNPEESYIAFKSRLAALEYGVYIDEDNVQTVVIYFGKIGENGLKYSDSDINFASSSANRVISLGYYDEEDRTDLINYFTQTYGDENIIEGNIANYVVNIQEEYSKVLTDTQKSNTAIITKDGVAKNVTGKGTLQGLLGSGSNSVATGIAKVYLNDKDTGKLLDGVSYKLQVKQSDGSWIDYASWSGGTTDTDGSIVTGVLGPGTYRFVQTSAYSNEYDMPNSDGDDSEEGYPISNTFTVTTSDTTGHIITMTNVKYKYTVKYEPGTKGDFSTITKSNVVINSTTPVYDGVIGLDGKPLANAGYTFAGWSPEVDEKVTGDATYVAQWVPATNTKYKVEHYLQQADGSYSLTDTDILTGSTGATVTGMSKTSYDGYYFDTSIVGTVQSGVISGDGNLTLKLYYNAKINIAYKVEHHLEQLDGSKVIHDIENFTGKTGPTVFVFPKSYDGYEVDSTNSIVRSFFLTGIVKDDGSLVFEVHYKLTKHSVTYTAGTHGTFDDTVYNNIAYGSDTPNYSGIPVGQVGYEFIGWSPEVTNTVTKDVVYKAQWKANVDTVYQVEHYLEQFDGSYAITDTETLLGTTDTEVEAIAKTYTGYAFDSSITGTKLKGNVSGDGSLVLKIYYVKKSQIITMTPSTYPEETGTAGVSTVDITDTNLWMFTMLGMLGGILMLKKKRKDIE